MTQLLQPGTEAPDFNLTSTDGSDYSLYSNFGELATVVTFFRGEW